MERQYKDSGIEWIGIIPKTWAIERMKGLFIERNERNCKGRTLLSVSQYFGIRPKSETDIADSHIAESYDDYKEVYQGDFVMNIMLAWNGSYAVSEYDGMVSPAYCVFKFRKDCCKKYFHYLLRTNGYPTAFKTMSRGVIDSRLRLYPEQFYTFPVIIPSVDEQQRISDYLDAKCGEIDSLIGLQEQMIEKLKTYKQSVITEVVTKGLNPNVKLVPSGVDWIGEIPEGWKVLPIKRICRNITDGSHFSPSTAGEGKPYITVSNVYGDEVHVEEAAKISFDDFSTLVANGCQPPTGSVLLAKDGTVGRTAVVYDNDYVVLSSLGILTPSNTVLSKYLKYLLDSDSLQAQMQLAMAGSALRRITITKICKFVGLLPPLNEQQVIIFYLDEKCSDIDRLIEMKQQKIEKLKDYKKSVIYEAVTGKISIES